MASSLTIDQLAQATGVSAKTMRYYEQQRVAVPTSQCHRVSAVFLARCAPLAIHPPGSGARAVAARPQRSHSRQEALRTQRFPQRCAQQLSCRFGRGHLCITWASER